MIFKISSLFFGSFLVLTLNHCGSADSARPPDKMLQLKLPQSISRHPKRLQRLLSRAVSLKVELTDHEGKRTEYDLAPSQWEQSTLLGIPAEIEGTGRIRIDVKLWDRESDGTLRRHPCFEGGRTWSRQDWNRQTNLTVTLSARVSAEAYDR